MANKYCNLDGSKKISQEYGKITAGFGKVESVEFMKLANKIGNAEVVKDGEQVL